MKKSLVHKLEIGQMAATLLAVMGVLLNNGQVIWCFPLWIVSNLLCLKYHWRAQLYGLAVRDVIFTVLSAVGWVQWSMML